MTDGMATVVVLSRYWPTALSVIRSLGAAGYTVDYVASSPEEGSSLVAASSRYVRLSMESVKRNVKRGDDAELLSNLLSYRSTEPKPVLFPTDDYTAAFADRHRSALEEIFIIPSADRRIFELMSKDVQAEYARKAGLNVPVSWTIPLEEGITIPEDMLYPCFCKPLESFSGYKGEMKKCSDRDELAEHLDFLRKRNPSRSILVQEFLEITGEIDLQGVCSGREVIIPGIIRKTRIAEYERGVTMAGYTAPLEELGDTAERIKTMLGSFGYRGIFDMELNLVGDKLYFGEVNLRSGGPNYAYFLNGVNLPAMAVRAVLGEEPCAETCELEYGKSFAYEKVIWKEFMKGCLTRAERDSLLTTADYLLIGSSDDERPIRLFEEEVQSEISNKRRRRIAGRIKGMLRPAYQLAKEVVRGYPQIKRANRRKPSSESSLPRALVVGRNYCSNLCMARSLGMAGYDVEILRIVSSKKNRTKLNSIIPEAYSRYVKAFHTCTRGQNGVNLLKTMQRIADPSCKMMVFPTEDVAAYIVDQYYDRLKEHYILPGVAGTEGELIRMMSKDVQKKLASEVGLKSIPGCRIRLRGGAFSIPEGMEYPCFIKPDVSRMTSKKRMRRCDSEKELERALGEIAASRDLDVIAEKFIDIRREISLLGISWGDKVACPGCFEVVEGGNGARRGVSIEGRLIDPDSLGPILGDVIRYMSAIDYRGLWDVDLIEDTDGQLYFIEVNMRFGASGYVLTRCGVNLPGMLADAFARGREPDRECRPSVFGRTFVNEKVIVEECADGNMSKAEAFRLIDEADVPFMKSDDDRRPYRIVKKLIDRL